MSRIKGVNAAKELHNRIGWTKPSDFSLIEIANSIGIHVKETPIEGSEGRILIKGNTGIISLNSAISYQSKKNFIIAHEIGHFIMHRELTYLFSDTEQTLSEWHKKGEHEIEANEFAAELLMPSLLFKDLTKQKRLSLQLINQVSTYFKVSLTAAFLRYVSLGHFPLMVVYIENGIIKWKQHSIDFPFQYLPIHSKVPPLTVAGDFFYHQQVEAEPQKLNAIEWFPNDFQIKFKKDLMIWEQCYQVTQNGIISCLWTF